MRKIATASVLALLVALGHLAPGAGVPAVAAAGPKVVIIVGATHSATSTYRTRADAAYAEAIKYTSNVVKVYSPNATWARVKAAIQGASIVIYMGHGNGFPSPYRTTPYAYSQNGFGLNADLNGDGKLSDYENKYYGEYYIGNEVKLAPNAVVLLNHLCYASGNSEPGFAEPSVSVARQRADNYAAGFLRAGARAVIADGHMGPAYYIRALFTTRQTIDKLWRAAPNFHNHAFSFASVRSPGYTVQMDPEGTSTDFYRSVAGRLDLLTSDAVAGAQVPTDVDPAMFAVPGNASVSVEGTGVYADALLTGTPSATLALNTRVRILAAGAASPASFQVATHDGTASGYVAAANLVPRDSTAPQVWSFSAGAVVSPNADTRADEAKLTATLSESAAWIVRVRKDAEVVWSVSGEGKDVVATWNAMTDGAPVADGTYRWVLDARDGWGNAAQARVADVRVDTVAPAFSSLALSEAVPALTFSPNADGIADTASLGWQLEEAGTVLAAIVDGSGATVRTLAAASTAGAGSMAWDGRSTAGAVVPDGLYTVRLSVRDAGGNTSAPLERVVGVFTALSKVTAAPIRFYPHDNDRFAASSTLSFTLSRAATVTWRITTADGAPVLTRYEATPLAAGTYTFAWTGRNAEGTLLPAGMYLSSVEATDGALSAVQRRSMSMNAFTISSSDTTPARGQKITVTAYSAEPTSGYVYLRVAQPGIPAWSVRMTKTATLTFKATITLKASSTGTVVLRVSGDDADGRWQRTYKSLPLH